MLGLSADHNISINLKKSLYEPPTPELQFLKMLNMQSFSAVGTIFEKSFWNSINKW